jgi:hypothetical protein
VTGLSGGELPETLSEELQAYMAHILDSRNPVEDRRFDEFVGLCRSTALTYQARGRHDEAQKWRNCANKFREAAAIRSELADKLDAYLKNSN